MAVQLIASVREKQKNKLFATAVVEYAVGAGTTRRCCREITHGIARPVIKRGNTMTDAEYRERLVERMNNLLRKMYPGFLSPSMQLQTAERVVDAIVPPSHKVLPEHLDARMLAALGLPERMHAGFKESYCRAYRAYEGSADE